MIERCPPACGDRSREQKALNPDRRPHEPFETLFRGNRHIDGFGLLRNYWRWIHSQWHILCRDPGRRRQPDREDDDECGTENLTPALMGWATQWGHSQLDAETIVLCLKSAPCFIG